MHTLHNVNLIRPINKASSLANGLYSCWIQLPGHMSAGRGDWVDLCKNNNLEFKSDAYEDANKIFGNPVIAKEIIDGKLYGVNRQNSCYMSEQNNLTSVSPNFSLTCVVHSKDMGGYGWNNNTYLCGMITSGFAQMILIGLFSGNITAYVGNVAGSNYAYLNSGLSFSNRRSYSITLTKEYFSGGNTTTLYINGKYITSSVTNYGRLDFTSKLKIYDAARLDNDAYATASAFGGSISMVSWHTRAMSKEEVVELHNEIGTNFPTLLNRRQMRVSTSPNVVSIPEASYSFSSLLAFWAGGAKLGFPIGGLSTVGNNNQYLWNSRAAAFNTRSHLWNILSTIGKSDSLLWNTLLTTSIDKNILFNVLENVGQDENLVWNALAVAGANNQSVWNTYQTVDKTSQGIWNILSLSSQTRELLWNEYQALGRNVDTLWDVYANVTLDRQFVWGVGGYVGKNVDIIYNALANVSNTNQVIWNDLTSINNSKEFIYDILVAVEKSRDIIWNTRASIGDQINIVYNNLANISNTSQVDWNVNTSVAKTKQLIFNILSLANADGELVWDTRATAAKGSELTWNIIQNIRNDIEILWNDYTVSQNSIEFEYNIRQAILKSVEKVWNVRALSSAEKEVLWNTIQLVTITSIYEIMLNIKTGMTFDVNILQRELSNLSVLTNKDDAVYIKNQVVSELDIMKNKIIILDKNGE